MRYTPKIADLCCTARDSGTSADFPCRDFLSELYREATRVQELVDGHGGQTNEKWFPFREGVAAVKLFSAVTYEVLHIRAGLSRYQLRGPETELERSTHRVVTTLRQAIITACGNFLEQLDRCAVRPPEGESGFRPCKSERLEGRLPADREVRHTERIGETVVYLATQFLNLSEDDDVQEVLCEPSEDGEQKLIPEPISEERLRLVEARFHNLQSLYDTYIFESDLEKQNQDLATLRGHISLIYHLCSIANDLTHYFIRHMSSLRRDTFLQTRFPISPQDLLGLLFEYPLRYARTYLQSAVQLCQSMIRTYSETTSIVVPIPNYRGFHVRPSTLIARIVAHYGSPVTMHLDGQEYDAGSSLDLFRANESINAAKRRQVADILSKQRDLQVPIPLDPEERTRELQLLFVRLINEGSVVLYDSNLSFDEIEAGPNETLAELAARYVVHLMSIAKMDIKSDMTVTFAGDSRALHDLKILAENGYGEDHMGNNVVLPDELSYLSR
ncbi:MAG: hypothetical protein R6V29_02210 [Spirochaetia bacterium]